MNLAESLAPFPNLIELLYSLPARRLDRRPCNYGRLGAHRHNSSVDPALPLSFVLWFASTLPFLGSLLVPPGPYPQADPNSRASDTVAHKELKRRHLNGAL